jgi:MFS family permease
MTGTIKSTQASTTQNVLHLSVIVASLGYFVDIYDLLLFGIVRVPSLKDLGVSSGDLLHQGVFLLNVQMAGLLFGGILWGILGDKRGRLTVLFGSILLYSLANLANAMVTTVPQYAALRFIAGIGLAGELGAAVTLVAETLHTSKRGYGTALISGIGLLGAAFAGFIAEVTTWRIAYVLGGVLGLMLLLLRIRLSESGMFSQLRAEQDAQGSGPEIRRGDFTLILKSGERLVRYVACILSGVPLWFMIGILITFIPEFAIELHATGPVTAGRAIASCYIGTAVGGLITGGLSQYLHSRKKVVLISLTVLTLLLPVYLNTRNASPETFYAISAIIGVAAGYWAVFITMAAEQFGTNLRATVTTTVPNFVRGAVVPITLAFQALKAHHSLKTSALLVGAVVFFLAFVSVALLNESSQTDLSFYEV